MIDQAKVADAYFNGKLTGMETALDTAKGADTFTKWLDFVQKGKFTDANALLSHTPGARPGHVRVP